MKLYIEKWTTETVHTGRLFAVDTATLRSEYAELQELSDEEIVEHLRECHSDYEFVNETEALEARNSSADHAEDSVVSVHVEDCLKRDLEWEAWRRGCISDEMQRRDIDPIKPDAFLAKIPEYK